MHNLYSRALMCALFILWQREGLQFIRQRGEKQFTHEKAAEMAVRKPIIHLYRLTTICG